VLGFAKIAGGMPSSAGPMTDHLMNQTLGPEQARLAAYYGRGTVRDDDMLALAGQVASGETPYGEALEALMSKHARGGGDPDLLDAARERTGKRLADVAHRLREGLADAPLAIVRPDAHPLALAGLGIETDGLLGRDEINALLAGRRADGEPVEGKQYAEERALPVDPRTGEVRTSVPIGSYDFCPTPDKSVSVAWAFAGPVEQAMIYNAHIEAAREAVGYVAAEIGRVRLGKGGRDGTEDGHVAWLEFTHHTSRRVQIKEGGVTRDAGPGDPDLHTHFLIPNAVFAESGKVGSLDTAAIGGFIFEADAFYHARLSQRLRDAGFETELDHRTGAARMPAVPDDVRTLFSKRTNAGEALARKVAADEGLDWDALAPGQRATRTKNATQNFEQKQKGGKDDVADPADWRRQAKDVAGWEPGSLMLYGPPVPPLAPGQRHRQAYDTALPHLAEKLEQKAVVTHWDLRVAALRGLVATGNDGLADVRAVTGIMSSEGVVQSGQKTALAWGREDGKRHVSVTTALHVSDEAEFIRLMKAAAADKAGAVSRSVLKRKMRASGLDLADGHGRAQKAAIENLGRGGRFALLIAAAGAGKTASLSPLVSAWKEQGRPVFGASLAWRQADDLAGAGIDRRNVKAFSALLDGIRSGDITPGRDAVVAVDEWGMIGTRSGLELLRAQARHGFKIVALGDDKQCASIEAGPVIDLSRRALGKGNVPEILTTKRQRTERERQIAGLLRGGRAAEALDMKREDGTAEMVKGGRAGVIARVAKLYAERLAATGEAPGINAPTNQDAHDISAAVRTERRALGLVGPDAWRVRATDGTRDYDLPLAQGDRVRLFASTAARYADGGGGAIGRNGSVLEVVGAGADGLTLKTGTGRVGTVEWGKLMHGGRARLAYGDAMTIHTAQGSSRGEQISAFPDGTGRVAGQAAYSALTRHFHASHMVTNEQAEYIAVQRRRPVNDARPIGPGDTWANVARSFASQPEKDSATALRERVDGLRRGGIKAFQASLLPAQPAHRAGGTSSPAPAIVQERRIDLEGIQALRRVIQAGLERGIATVRQAIGRKPGPARRIEPLDQGPRLRL
jgi:conjugative relaxase-like TrwC/TraI family protein